MEGVPDARFLPVAQPAPAGAPAATSQLQRQHLPLDTGLEHVDDATQGRAVGVPRMPALRLRRVRRQERFDDGPEFVADQFMYFHAHARGKGGAMVVKRVLSM